MAAAKTAERATVRKPPTTSTGANGSGPKARPAPDRPTSDRCAYGIVANLAGKPNACERVGTQKYAWTFYDLPDHEGEATAEAGFCARCIGAPGRVSAVQSAIQSGRLREPHFTILKG